MKKHSGYLDIYFYHVDKTEFDLPVIQYYKWFKSNGSILDFL